MVLLDQLDLPDQQGHKDQQGLTVPTVLMVLLGLQDHRVLLDQQDLLALQGLLDRLVLLDLLLDSIHQPLQRDL